MLEWNRVEETQVGVLLKKEKRKSDDGMDVVSGKFIF